MFRASCLPAVLASLCAQDAPAPKPAAAATVVFVGNSYTHFHDLPAFVAALGRAATPPRTVTTHMVAPGGFTLKQHWNTTGDGSARRTIAGAKATFVVLQEQSRMPLESPKEMRDHAAKFAKLVAGEKATTVWYMTWARFEEPEAQGRIRDAYAQITKTNGGLLAPVGTAWEKLRAAHPDQRLHTDDGSHPNPSGTYLAACVLYATMFGGDVTAFPDKLERTGPDGKTATLIELAPEEGKRLRTAAAAALAPPSKK